MQQASQLDSNFFSVPVPYCNGRAKGFEKVTNLYSRDVYVMRTIFEQDEETPLLGLHRPAFGT